MQQNDTCKKHCFSLSRIKSELLAALGKYPSQIQSNQVSVGDLALDLGKTLTWLAGYFDGQSPVGCEPLGQTPQSVESLGKHFQAVGIEALSAENVGLTRQDQKGVEYAAAVLNRVSQRIQRRKGGAL